MVRYSRLSIQTDSDVLWVFVDLEMRTPAEFLSHRFHIYTSHLHGMHKTTQSPKTFNANCKVLHGNQHLHTQYVICGARIHNCCWTSVGIS